MKNALIVFLVFISFQWSYSQGVNIDSISHVDYQALHQANLNDCWGYTDETGIEYALVGTTKGTSIVSLADPLNPIEIVWIPGSESIWLDLQVYDDYAYITTEAEDGLLIIDLSPLPASTTLPTTYYFGPSSNPWQSAHDIFIDPDQGWAYICGANRGNGGIIILDIHTNPMVPIEVGEFDNWYCHDAFSQGNKLYGAHISDGLLSVIDVSNRVTPILLGTKITPNAFTHNVWVTSDDQFAVTTDEVTDASITMYDVSNPSSIIELDRIQSSPDLTIIPHNAFIVADTILATSYYTDGIVIHDMKRPHNLVEIASYDTHPSEASSFEGAWGVYPFFQSGIYLASDITRGLFVLKPQLIQAAYFEGLVIDSISTNPIENVKVEIQNDPQIDFSNFNGEFAVGTVNAGQTMVTFSKIAYYPKTVMVDFVNGQLLLDTIELAPIPPTPITIIVEDLLGNPIIGADVRIRNAIMDIDDQTNGFGESAMNIYYPGQNTIIVGKWGYVTQCIDQVIDDQTGTVTVQLESGYFDDFSFDFGWTAASVGAISGFWERGRPFYSGSNATPTQDADYDCGYEAFITGNGAYFDSDIDDVDDGTVVLYSPIFDLSTYTDPHVNFVRFFFNYFGPNQVNDSMQVFLSNGTQTELIDFIGPNINQSEWQVVSKRVLDFLNPTSSMQLIVKVSDDVANINITDAAFDFFTVTNQSILAIDEETFELKLFPNPVEDQLTIQSPAEGVISIYSIGGLYLETYQLQEGDTTIDLSSFAPGIYLIQKGEATFRVLKQ
ncbi:MAG: choice-of-anchor B family protein [Fluviicola sp.]|nr:choice-of-anchor B family protein [Fluviicola sp.]